MNFGLRSALLRMAGKEMMPFYMKLFANSFMIKWMIIKVYLFI